MHVELFDPDELREALGRTLFRIRMEDSGCPYFGSGFFIHSEGYALTAFHNLPSYVLTDRRKPITETFRDQPCNPPRLIPSPRASLLRLSLRAVEGFVRNRRA